MSETERAEPTAAQLQERLREKRRALGLPEESKHPAGAEASGRSGVLGLPETASALCLDCGHDFTYRVTRVGDMQVLRRRWCDRCQAVRDGAERDLDGQQAAHEAAAEARKRELEILKSLEAAGANTPEFRDATLANWDPTEAGIAPLRAVRDFLGEAREAGPYDPVRGVYLHGPTGTGKTHLAIGVLRELLATDCRRTVIVDHASELIARIQDTYNTRSSTFAVLEKRFRAGVWILDDLGTERPSDDVARHLTLLFTRRALRPTIVTSNESPQALEARGLGRVVSRLGPKYFRVVPVDGRDRRFD